NGLKDLGVVQKRDVIRGTTYAGIIAAIGLTVVYLSLSWIGRTLTYDVPIENGAEILVLASNQLFTSSGNIVFGSIVLLACLTTCVGLTNACARFFHSILPNISYINLVRLFVVIGLLITNLGLDTILSIATPLLVFIYPFTIVLFLLTFFQYVFSYSKKMVVFSMIVTSIFAISSVLDALHIDIHVLDSILRIFPLYENGLGWVLPALCVGIVGYIWDRFFNRSD